MKRRQAVFLIAWLAAAVAAAPVAGTHVTGRTTTPSASVSLDQAVHMVEERYHARVVKTQTQTDDGRTVYVMRLLNDSGKVWTVRVDAASGYVR
jgi:uncharacterized membrane protein YkoI